MNGYFPYRQIWPNTLAVFFQQSFLNMMEYIYITMKENNKYHKGHVIIAGVPKCGTYYRYKIEKFTDYTCIDTDWLVLPKLSSGRDVQPVCSIA